MQKFLSGLIAAFMLSAGLVAVSGTVAGAAPGAARACGSQYTPPCVATKTQAKGTTGTKKKAPKVSVEVRANGNVKPAGKITVVIKPGNKKVTATYKGKKLTLNLPKLKPGKYTATITYTPASNSNFKPSKTSARITVKK